MTTSTQITENYMELLPAYGRDYKSGKAAKADFLNGKDWQDARSQSYCSIRDFARGTIVILRFKRLAAITSIKVP